MADPRRFSEASADPFVAAQAHDSAAALTARYAAALDAGDDAAALSALSQAPSPDVFRALQHALDRAVEVHGDPIGVRLFAFPLLIVTGGHAGARISAVVPAIERVVAILREAGVLGQTQNFSLSAALTDVHGLHTITPSRVRRLALGRETLQSALDVPPREVVAATAGEEVHLRFLVGAALIPAHAPSVLETAAAIGLWGMALTRELSEQLQGDGASVLPIPRPPASLTMAPSVGDSAREDLALQAFLSRELRQFRSEVGEPEVSVAPLDCGAVGIRLSSPFIEDRVRTHRRRLLPHEDLEPVLAGMLTLLEECRLENFSFEAAVQPTERFEAGGAPAH